MTTASDAASSRAAKALARLAQLHPKLIDLGLERSFALLKRLGNPHHRLPPTIHVAGTNGKGSVIAFLRALAEAAGLSTHVYTSPHLCHFNERIRLAGTLIGDDALADLLEEVEALNGTQNVTFFEVTTAAAMLAFSRVPADFLLLETGLGGALDSTNVLARPAATIITPIARDHEHFLGSNLNDIATQKAGIMRQDCPCFSAAQTPEVLDRLVAYAAEVKTSLYIAGRDFQIETASDGGICLQWNGQEYALPSPRLKGHHQQQNAGLATAAFLQVMAETCHDVSAAQLGKAMQTASWPARVQRLETGRLTRDWPYQPIWLDGAHNAHGAAALANTLARLSSGKWNIICGALNTRDPVEFLLPLGELAGPVRCLTIPGQDSSLDATDLAAVAQSLGMDAHATAGLDACFATLDPDLPVIICGSLYLAGHILLENETPPN